MHRITKPTAREAAALEKNAQGFADNVLQISSGNVFWDAAAHALLKATFLYVASIPDKEPSVCTVCDVLVVDNMEALTTLKNKFEELPDWHPSKNYAKSFLRLPNPTKRLIIGGLIIRLSDIADAESINVGA